MKLASLVLAICVALIAGCSGGNDGPSYKITDQPLQGNLNGVSWQLVAGATNEFLSSGEDDFFTEMFDESFTVCTGGTPVSDHLIVSVPKETGDYGFGNFLNMTFVWNDAGETQNYVATTGRIVVDSVTATSVSGGLYAIFENNPDFEVDGQFSATVCP